MPNDSKFTPGVTLSLAGRTALVTGGSRGIGAATVRLFRQAGARVAFSYRAARPQAEALSTECGGPAVCLPIQQDLATPEDGEALVASTIKSFGDLDILIVNHGIWPPVEANIATMSAAQWRRTQAINVDSVFGLVHAAAAHMLTRPLHSGSARGHIVLIASSAGQRGEAGHADYAASKGALISLTKSLSSELAPHGIYATSTPPSPSAVPATSTRSPALSSSSAPRSPASSPAKSSTSTAAPSSSVDLPATAPHCGVPTACPGFALISEFSTKENLSAGPVYLIQ